MTIEKLSASASGRICLFGEHQDFLGLAVIAMAIDRRFHISAVANTVNRIRIEMPDIGETAEFAFDEELPYEKERDYLRSVFNVLYRRGYRLPCGYDFEFRSTIPILGGCSSSSAMVIVWAKMLSALAAGGPELSNEPLALAGYEAEVLEFKEPGGMMDHYCAAFGGLLHIDCADPFRATRLPGELTGFVLGNSGPKTDTTGVLARTKTATRRGVEELRKLLPEFTLKHSRLAEVEEHFGKIDATAAEKIRAQLENRDICDEAEAMLRRGKVDSNRLGELLDGHHARLRDVLRISTDKLEALIDAAHGAGASGCKLNGSGGGGTMIAYCPGQEETVAEAIRRAGGDAGLVEVAGGAETA